MTPICRTPDCRDGATDELGFCAACRARYDERRALAAEVTDRLCAQQPELFAQLSDTDGHQLAEHLVAHVSEGERGFYARFWAGMDFVRETDERAEARQRGVRVIATRRRLRGGLEGAPA